jgi:hypothetical protein
MSSLMTAATHPGGAFAISIATPFGSCTRTSAFVETMVAGTNVSGRAGDAVASPNPSSTDTTALARGLACAKTRRSCRRSASIRRSCGEPVARSTGGCAHGVFYLVAFDERLASQRMAGSAVAFNRVHSTGRSRVGEQSSPYVGRRLHRNNDLRYAATRAM